MLARRIFILHFSPVCGDTNDDAAAELQLTLMEGYDTVSELGDFNRRLLALWASGRQCNAHRRQAHPTSGAVFGRLGTVESV